MLENVPEPIHMVLLKAPPHKSVCSKSLTLKICDYGEAMIYGYQPIIIQCQTFSVAQVLCSAFLGLFNFSTS